MREIDDKKGKRELILDAAVKVFSRQGYHEARMEDIAQETGIGKGTIYEYFSGKLELFQEMLIRCRGIYYNSLLAGDAESLSFRERLKLIFVSHINFCLENKELTRVVFWDTKVMDEELKAWSYEKRKEKESMLTELIVKAVQNGEIRAVDPEVLTMMITGILGAVWGPLAIENREIEAESLAEKITDLVFDGIKL